jgi:hypothetical protein
MGLSLHLLQYADEGEDMFNRTVTGDESWMHHYQPKSKGYFNAMATKKFQVMNTPSTEKVYAYHVLGFSGSTAGPFSEAE